MPRPNSAKEFVASSSCSNCALHVASSQVHMTLAFCKTRQHYDCIAQEWQALLEASGPRSCTWMALLRDTKQRMQPIRQQVIVNMNSCMLSRALCHSLSGQDTPASRAINSRSNELFTTGANWISAQIISEVNRISLSLMACFHHTFLHQSFHTKLRSAPSRHTIFPRPSCFSFC